MLLNLFILICLPPFLYQISPDDNFTITKDGAIHKLVIIRCKEEHSGKYRFEADGRKTEAMINVKGLRICDDNNIVLSYNAVQLETEKNILYLQTQV